MQEVLRNVVVMAAWAAVVWSLPPPSAHGQGLRDGRQGEHLVFPYWSVEDGTNTNVAVHRHRGVRDPMSGEKPTVGQVAVRDRMGKIATEFKICLMPGDSWTATLAAAGLRVGSPGACDDKIHQGGGTRTGQLVPSPKRGEVVALGPATSGWLEVWQTPAKALKDGPDADTEPDHATASYLGGKATLVSPGAGFASTYDALAAQGCGDWVQIPGDGVSGYRSWLLVATYPDSDSDATNDRVDTGDGCRNVDRDGNGVVQEKKTGILNEFRIFSKSFFFPSGFLPNSLVGRWTALNDENVRTSTKVVITLLEEPRLRYEGQKTAGGPKVTGTDPVSILVFDEDGGIALDSREVLLDRDVNVCTFLPEGMAMEDAMGLTPGLSCNGRWVGALQGTSGLFRIFNNTAVVIDAAGLVTNAGTEATDLSIKKATAGATTNDPPTRPAGGQVPDANYRFPALGLIFSYFRGTDGREYDQVAELQRDWHSAASRDAAGTAEDARTDNPDL